MDLVHFVSSLGGLEHADFKQKSAFVVAAFVFIFVLFACALFASTSKSRYSAGGKQYKNEKMKQIMKSCREMIDLSTQDSNSTIRLAHANYAQAYLNVAKVLNTDEEIFLETGMDPDAIQKEIQQVEKHAMRSAHKLAEEVIY